MDKITYKSNGIEVTMDRAIATDFVDRLLDGHLFSDPIEDWLWAWGKELGLLEESKESKWAEIRSDYYDDEEGVQTVDAWLTDDDNEEGKVIAKIRLDTKEVIYLDKDARRDCYAQEVINEVLENGFDLTE